jgi:copper transport protein
VQFAAITLGLGALIVVVLAWLPALATVAGGGGGWLAASQAFAGRARLALLGAAAAGLAAALVALPLQAATAEGTTFWAGVSNAREVLDTRFGTVWGLGALAWLAVLALAGARRAPVPALRSATVGAEGAALPASGRGLAVLAVPLLALAFLPALGGHAGVEHPVVLLLPANVLHVIAAAAWIGGLAVLVLALPAATRRLEPPDRTRLLTATLGRFSTLALISVIALLVGGIGQSLLELSAPDDLLDTAFGRAILIKIVLVCALIALGALNRRRTLPALDRAEADGGPPGRAGAVLRRTLRAEVALGVAALAVTGALAGYAPATAMSTGPVSGSTDLGPARLEYTVEPAMAGPNEIHLYLFDRRDGRLWNATKELTVQAALPERRIAAIELEPRKAGPGHYVIGGAPLSPAGDWTLLVVSRVSDFDEFRTRFEVPIK